MREAVVAAIWRHPVKSMQGESPRHALLDRDGLVGDRVLAVVDRASGVVLNAKREGRLLQAMARTPPDDATDPPLVTVPGHEEVPADAPELDGWLSSWLDRDVVLTAPDPTRRSMTSMPADFEDDASDPVEWRMRPRRFHDLAPVHVLTTASLRAMAAGAPDLDWRVRRFRPTILVDVDDDDRAIEQSWVGAALHVGASAVVTVSKPTVRCVMTTRTQPASSDDEPIDRQLDVLRTLHRLTDGCLGVYANVAVGGTIAVGDLVTVEVAASRATGAQ